MNEVLVNSSSQITCLLTAKSYIEAIISNLNLILIDNISTSNAIDEIITKIKKQKGDISQKESYVVIVKKIDELIKSIENVSQDINIKIKSDIETKTNKEKNKSNNEELTL